jgi:hypothetical protein
MGRYHETSIHDDWDGVLHCTNKECNYEVRRYKSMDNFEPEPDRVVKLSPAAQAILDAYGSETGDIDCVWHSSELKGLAAVLRAAASQLTSAKSSDKLRTIANELEAMS